MDSLGYPVTNTMPYPAYFQMRQHLEFTLTMTVPYKYKSEPWTKVCTSEDWGGKVLEQVGGKEQIGERFHYSTLGVQVLSNIIAKATDIYGGYTRRIVQ